MVTHDGGSPPPMLDLLGWLAGVLGWLAGATTALVSSLLAELLQRVHDLFVWRMFDLLAWRLMPAGRTLGCSMALIAHRGASAAHPENTMRAMLAALDAGAHGVEYDLQQLADGTLIVLHDETLRRTARRGVLPADDRLLDMPVGELRLTELERVDVGGGSPPTFERMLATLLARDSSRLSFAELKRGSGGAMVAEALRIARKLGAGPQSVVWISFDAEVCAQLKRAAPEYRVLLLGLGAREHDVRALLERAHALGLDGIDAGAHPGALTPAVVRDAHARGMLVAAWVYKAPAANDREGVWEYMHRADVDFFTTNWPDTVAGWADRTNGGRAPHAQTTARIDPGRNLEIAR
ncbi:hypothetical protein KFE25_013257 [Diacronema lutheri]|uniref:GP-PDE domain-containing protein n=2 Tax=Diacronema lutheri TaxID=2081491 RepID=A0A8J6CD28_DIALT|nr:hypothetical protein KFE25_013257 [Diacronema lutheri]